LVNWNRLNNELSEAILEADRLDELLAGLGCDLRHSHGETLYRGPCPVHLGDGANFQLRTGGRTLPVYWKCFSHHCEDEYKPSLLGLVRGVLSAQRMKPVPLREALDYLTKFVGARRTRAQSWQSRPSPPRPKLLSLTRAQVRRQLVIPSPYFVGRAFSPAVLDALDVGHSPKLRKTVVPVYDDAGRTCVGYIARSEKPHCLQCDKCHDRQESCGRGERRWDVLTDFPKGNYLLNYAAASASNSPFVLLVEGPGDVFRAMEAGVPAVAAFGSDLSSTQANKLAALNKRIVVALDNDKAGREGTKRAQNLLNQRRVIAGVCQPPAGFHDVGDMPAEAVVAWMKKWQGRTADMNKNSLCPGARAAVSSGPTAVPGHFHSWPGSCHPG
jgi:Toprim-like